MPILATNRQNTMIRAIARSDVRNILRMFATDWRVYLRMPPHELRTRLNTLSGFIATDLVGMRGFMVIEPQPPHTAFLIAAGLRDTWHLKPFLDLLLPKIEESARGQELSRLVYLGNAGWLIEALRQRDFQIQEWVISLERMGIDPPPSPPTPALLRPVQKHELRTIINMDGLTFDEIWHYAVGNIADALVNNDSFTLAEIDGRIVGFEWCEIYGPRAHLTRLAVHPDYQGRGVGGQLLHQAIVEAIDRGVNYITLNTQEDNYRSLALYQRFGFKLTPRRMPLLLKELD